MSSQNDTPVPLANRIRIDGWKAIAAWFNADVKTVQRWEKQRSVPVHRIPGTKPSKVFAWEDELAAWMAQPEGQIPTGETISSSTSRRRFLWPGAALGLAAGGLLYYQRRPQPRIARVAIGDGTVQAFDGSGAVRWEYAFPYLSVPPSPSQPWRTTVWKASPAGPERVLAAPAPDPARGSANETLFCFSSSGKLMWQVGANPGLLDFDGSPFEKGWCFSHLITTSHPAPAVWAAIVHNKRWASCVVRISEQGLSKVQFANFGHCQALTATPDERLMFVVGVNNALDRTFIAAIGTGDPPSSAPREGPPRYAFANAPGGAVRHYAVLPTTEFNVHFASRQYAHVERVQCDDEIVTLSSRESDEPLVEVLYEFTHALNPRVARPGSGCATAHQRLEKAGLVGHAWEGCPLARGPLVIRVWGRDGRWEERAMPVALPTNLVGWRDRAPK